MENFAPGYKTEGPDGGGVRGWWGVEGWGGERTPACCLSLDRSLINSRRQGETALAPRSPPHPLHRLPPPPTPSPVMCVCVCEPRQKPARRQLFGTERPSPPPFCRRSCPAEGGKLELFMKARRKTLCALVDGATGEEFGGSFT